MIPLVRRRYRLNVESALAHCMIGKRSVCGLLDLVRTTTMTLPINRKMAEHYGLCLKCRRWIERDDRITALEQLAAELEQTAHGEGRRI